MSIESQASKLCAATELMDSTGPCDRSARAGKRAHSVRQDGSRPHGAVILSAVAQWWHEPILRGLVWLTSLDGRYVSIVSRLGPDTLYLIVSRVRFNEYSRLCISLYLDLSRIQCISLYP